MGPEHVTTDWIGATLGGDVAAVEVERIGDGLVGMNLRVRLVDADPGLPSSVVVKLPSPDPTSRAAGIGLRNYEREVRFYLDIAPTVDIRVPRCHLAEWVPATGDFVLVLEDMAPAVPGDQIAGCDIGSAALAVEELAKLHGPRWDDPALHDVDWLTRRTTSDDIELLQGLWAAVLPGFCATFDPYLSFDARRVLDAFGERLGSWLDGRPEPFAVTHGDYRLDNLLFGTGAGTGAPPVTVVDWQTPGHGPPVSDLAYFLGAGPIPEARRAHEHELVGRYADALGGRGVDVDRAWLWQEYRREAFAGVVMAVIASQIVGTNDRSEAMFAAMATRHLEHARDVDALDLI